MVNHIFFFIYVFAVGATCSAVSLSLLFWLRKRNSARRNTFFFIVYLAFVLFLTGLRFFGEVLIGGGQAIVLGTGIAESAGYALLLYFLPHTVNHIVGRPRRWLQLTSSLTATGVYFILGVVYLTTGFHPPLFIAAAALYSIAMAVILVDILRSLPRIRRRSSRLTVLMATLLTAAFLPLVMAARLLSELGGENAVSPSLKFLFLTVYYLWMAISGTVFYIREMSSTRTASPSGHHVPVDLPLTERERHVADSLSRGLTYGEIASDLGISPNTVRNHVANVYKKLSVRSKVELLGVLRGEREF